MDQLENQIIHTHSQSYFDYKTFLSKFHYYEPYDKTKEYTAQMFQQDFGKGLLTYKYELYKFNTGDDILEFICAEEHITDEEAKKLAPYCQCKYHLLSWYNPMKYCTCKCCHGCLETEFRHHTVIDKTRVYVSTVKN